MKTYTITSISDNRVMVKEVNSIPRPDFAIYLRYGSEGEYAGDLKEWREVESNLKEHELTEDSIRIGVGSVVFTVVNAPYGIWKDFTGNVVEVDSESCLVKYHDNWIERLKLNKASRYSVGQTITGTVVQDKGASKIKVI